MSFNSEYAVSQIDDPPQVDCPPGMDAGPNGICLPSPDPLCPNGQIPVGGICLPTGGGGGVGSPCSGASNQIGKYTILCPKVGFPPMDGYGIFLVYCDGREELKSCS